MKYESIMSPEYITKFAAHINCTKSTADGLSDYLSHEESHEQTETLIRDPVDCLSAIIQSDTLNVLHLMDLALSEIRRFMLDDTFIQQRLVHWRHLLERFDTELHRLEASLTGFTDFLKRLHYGPQDFPSVEARITQCTTRIAHLKQRTERTYKSLMANMSIVESKRGIAEAESVTKLTELAFFFIPLTFSASIFSMQVKELSKAEVSLWAFFVLAITITTCSYALRLIIRSRWVIKRRENLFERIREKFNMQPGDPIPTMIFLAWFWRRSKWYLFFIGIAIVPAGLVGFIWSRPLARAIQAVLTLLIYSVFFIIFRWVGV